MNDSTSWAVVAQQALEMGQSAVAEIVTAVKGIAPELWVILIRQVYAEAITFLIFNLLLLCIFAIVFIHGYRDGVKAEWDDRAATWWFVLPGSGIPLMISLITFVVNGPSCVRMLINPEYYAIQKFFAIASGGGL